MQPRRLSASHSPSPESLQPAAEELWPSGLRGSSSTPMVPLADIIRRATEHCIASSPQMALALLKPLRMQPEAQQHYGFQAQLGAAYMGVVDDLKKACVLGAFSLQPDANGDWLRPTVQAERLSCYVGALTACSRFLQLTARPHVKQRMMRIDGDRAAEVCIAAMAAGKKRASLEIQIFITRIAAINAMFASRQSVASALARGLLQENDTEVQSLRRIAGDPLYAAIVEACREVNQAARAAGQAPQVFWHSWAEETKRFYANIEQQLASCTNDSDS